MFWKKEVTSTIDIPNYNIALIGNDILLYSDIMKRLSQKSIERLNAVFFDDSAHRSDSSLLKFLIEDKRFDISKTNRLLFSCAQVGELANLKLIVEDGTLVNQNSLKEAILGASSAMEVEVVKYLLDYYEDKSILNLIFSEMFLSYISSNLNFSKVKQYLVVIYPTIDKDKLNFDHKDIFDVNSSIYEKELSNLLAESEKVYNF